MGSINPVIFLPSALEKQSKDDHTAKEKNLDVIPSLAVISAKKAEY